jgi:hypothetical protein
VRKEVGCNPVGVCWEPSFSLLFPILASAFQTNYSTAVKRGEDDQQG